MRILLVQQDATEVDLLTAAFERLRIFVEWTNDGLIAGKILARDDFDGVILDLDLPGKSGLSVLSQLRAAGNLIPAIVLTDQSALRHRVAAFEAGADDFLARPFAVEELLARVNAVMRRSFTAEYRALTCGPLALDLRTQQFTLDGAAMRLSFREYMLLHALIRRAHSRVSKQVLFDRTFRPSEDANIAAIEVLVHRLRKKLAGTPVRIVSVRGFGYSLATDGGDERGIELHVLHADDICPE